MVKNVEIIQPSDMAKRFMENKKVTTAAVFAGKVEDQASSTNRDPLVEAHVTPGSPVWEGSEGQYKLFSEIRKLQDKLKVSNAAQAPSQAELDTLVQKILIDITRKTQDIGDITSLIASETVNYGFSKSISLEDFLPYVGEFKTIRGTGDSVPLIEQFTGNVRSVTMTSKGLGFRSSLDNYLFNSIFDINRVNKTFARAYIDHRNSQVINPIVEASYDNSQKVTASNVSGDTYDVKLYKTLLKAYKALINLKDPLTGRKIIAPKVRILSSTVDAFDIRRVLNGQLTTGGTKGEAASFNAQSLAGYIDQIVTFDHGNFDGFLYGKKTLSYPGVTTGTFYMYVPNVFQVFTKRPLTMSSGPGPVLTLSNTDMAAYTCGTKWSDLFFGSTSEAFEKAGTGYIVEVKMPSV